MYFVVEVSKDKNGAIAKAVTEKETQDMAVMLFHQIMATMYANKDAGNISYGMCSILNNAGREETAESIGNPDAVEVEE